MFPAFNPSNTLLDIIDGNVISLTPPRFSEKRWVACITTSSGTRIMYIPSHEGEQWWRDRWEHYMRHIAEEALDV